MKNTNERAAVSCKIVRPEHRNTNQVMEGEGYGS